MPWEGSTPSMEGVEHQTVFQPQIPDIIGLKWGLWIANLVGRHEQLYIPIVVRIKHPEDSEKVKNAF